ncbi:MAG: multiheme c-type cytochrome [Desulfobacterales bacterium]|nr:multiheme c-type cytochrome [Desulfobacterales bacterium]
MKISGLIKLALSAFLLAQFFGCGGGETQIDIEQVLSKPKAYVGSGECKYCHLEHYDSWRTTLHSRTLADVTKNRDALIAEINPATIRADLQTHQAQLKLPVNEIYIPKIDEIKYTMGIQWKQSFLVEKKGTLYVAPIQYNAKTEHWVSYHEEDWDKRPWNKYCGGCHAMGVDLEKNTFSETSVGCEACHGPGSHHVALPETAVFDKRSTIVNPSQLPAGFRTQICGSCHNRGKSIKMPDTEWPVDYRPGRALGLYYKSASFAAGDVKNFYANEFAKGHHQQYLDWQQSAHSREGVTCTSCHYVHQLGVAPTQSQTKGAGSQQCLMCHKVINNNASHSIHSFANCIGCHMPKIAKSAESGDTHSHAFVTLLPKDTLKNPAVPNSCQTCHKHKDTDLATLQKVFDGMAQKSLLQVHQVR